MTFGLQIRTSANVVINIDGYPARFVATLGPFYSSGVHFVPCYYTGEGTLRNINMFYSGGAIINNNAYWVIDAFTAVSGGINVTTSGPYAFTSIGRKTIWTMEIYEVDV